jgi:hypothetical protein
MARRVGLSVDGAIKVVDRAVAVVESLSTLKKPRVGVTAAVCNRAGERDGWVCRICGGPVDPTLQHLQLSPTEARAHAEHLARFGLDEVALVITWVGADGNRAEAATRWFLDAVEAVGRRVLFEEAEAGGFLRAMHAPRQARTEHNKKAATVEHLHPVSLGGTNRMENLAIAHRGCNTHYNPVAENAALVAAPKDVLDFLTLLKRGGWRTERMSGCFERAAARSRGPWHATGPSCCAAWPTRASGLRSSTAPHTGRIASPTAGSRCAPASSPSSPRAWPQQAGAAPPPTSRSRR